jgi:hypothetical protein
MTIDEECHFIRQCNEYFAQEIDQLINELDLSDVAVDDDVDLSETIRYIEAINENIVNKINKLPINRNV